MPQVDSSELDAGRILTADVCIVGGGAVGLAIARDFLGSPHSVLVVEAGGALFEDESQDAYRSTIAGLPHGGVHVGRARVLGGSTTLWAGQALPFFDIDFERRAWVGGSGWPIERRALDAFYRRAEDVIEVPHATNDRTSWPAAEPPPAYDEASVTTYYSQFTSVPDFAKKYRRALAAAPNIRLLTHAAAVALNATPDARAIRDLSLRGPSGAEFLASARYYVVCCGGIDTPRLLLNSNGVEPAGVGNRHDVVGRYFADHPQLSIPVRPLDRARFGAWYDSFRKNGIRYAVKVVASPALQRAERILHAGGEVYYPTDGDDALFAARAFARLPPGQRDAGAFVRAARAVLKRPDRVAVAAFRRFVRNVPASVGSTPPRFIASCEQEPNAASRVMLGDERDRFGSRRTVLDWRLGQAETRTFGIFLERLAAEWRRLGVAHIDPAAVALEGRERGEHGGYWDNNHHLGTTRMGTDPRTSVVDDRCRVHGYDNLYVGGSSVFPTGGFSNPTLTAIALALRAADEIKLRLVSAPLDLQHSS